MAVSTTNISFYGNTGTPPYDGIWSIANPGAPSQSNESLRDLLAYDYFHGPNGGNTVNFNGWGTYTGTSGTAGDSRIYGLSANGGNTNYRMNLLSALEYYYDNTTYYSQFTVYNNLGPGPPPPPPTDNNINANIYFGNPFGNFPYMSGGGLVMQGGNQNWGISNSGSSPLINNGFWYLNVTTSPNFQAGGASMDLTINGNTIFTGAALGVNANYNNDWTNYVTIQTVSLSGGYYGFDCILTVY